MKNHSYLDLKIGAIEQYSMIVEKQNLERWKKMGWLTYKEIGLPKGDEKASMLYGEFNKRTEMLIFNKPVLLRERTKSEIVGRKISGITTSLGTYGMGGAGFFGLLLDNSEFLTYAVWSAGDYVLINDRVVECHPDLYHKTRPWTSYFGENRTWDDLSDFLVGSIVKDYSISKEIFILTTSNEKEVFKIEFVKNDIRLPREVGRKRNAFKKGVISDYILFQHQDGTLIV
jgi:hypothetical protein